jgi:membrane protein involved in colicin uptake
VKAQREEAERQAAGMIEAAKADAALIASEAKAKLEEQIKRRAEMAERKIAQAEAQAAADVKSAAVDLAAQAAEQILVARLASGGSDGWSMRRSARSARSCNSSRLRSDKKRSRARTARSAPFLLVDAAKSSSGRNVCHALIASYDAYGIAPPRASCAR